MKERVELYCHSGFVFRSDCSFFKYWTNLNSGSNLTAAAFSPENSTTTFQKTKTEWQYNSTRSFTWWVSRVHNYFHDEVFRGIVIDQIAQLSCQILELEYSVFDKNEKKWPPQHLTFKGV